MFNILHAAFFLDSYPQKVIIFQKIKLSFVNNQVPYFSNVKKAFMVCQLLFR